MKKKVLLDWIEALRSSNYTLISGKMYDGKDFCPLGLLCEISKKSDWIFDEHYQRFTYFNQNKYLPKEICEWAGITDKEKTALTAYIIHYNDVMKQSSQDIAKFLEEKYQINKQLIKK